MLASVRVQLSAVSEMTPRRLVPAFSSSCAPAFSSTPVTRNANAAAVTVGSLSRHEHAARIVGDDAHRNAGGDEFLVGIAPHQRIPLGERAPAIEPVGLAWYRQRRLDVEPRPELVAIFDERRRASVVIR